jgi:hypothetical protein
MNLKLYPGEIQKITIDDSEGIDETSQQVRDWVRNYGYREAILPDMDSGVWQRVVHNKRRAFDQLTELGIRREHVKQAVGNCSKPGGTFAVRLSARLDWPRGDYGDSGSCLYGSYSANLDAMRHLGTLVLQFFDDYDRGIGRVWVGVYPMYEDISGYRNERRVTEGLMTFGSYGATMNFENRDTSRPTPILAALVLQQLTDLKMYAKAENEDRTGIWLGNKGHNQEDDADRSRPPDHHRSSYNSFEQLERPRSGWCAACEVEVHALDSRWSTYQGNVFMCMECVLAESFTRAEV